MRRRDFIKTAGSAAALGAVSHAAASTHEGEDTVSRLRSLEPRPLSPFNVGRSAQLFVDRVLVRQTRGVAFTLHPGEKHPANPLVRADRPWEGWRLEIYGNALYDPDEKVFKMWYLAEGGGHFRFEYPSLYAVSSRRDRLGEARGGDPPGRKGRTLQATTASPASTSPAS